MKIQHMKWATHTRCNWKEQQKC